jgi:hypothetical protein
MISRNQASRFSEELRERNVELAKMLVDAEECRSLLRWEMARFVIKRRMCAMPLMCVRAGRVVS